MATNTVYPGKYCQRVGLSVDDFLYSENTPMPRLSNVTKGTVCELDVLRREHSMTWIQFYYRMKALCDTTFTLTFSSFKVTIGRIDKKKTELTRNKRYQELEDLFMQPFCTCVPSPDTTELTRKPEMSEIQIALEKEKKRNEHLSSKLSTLTVRNVNKRIKRRDVKIAVSQSQVKEMDLELKHKMKTIDKLENRLHTTNTSVRNLQQKLYCSNAKVETTSTENTELALKLETLESEFTAKVDELQQKIQCLITEVDLARHERDILSERLDDMESNTVRTKQGQKFIDGVRQCCIELLSMNVGTKQVEPVIRSVLRNIASIEVGELPKPSTLCGMLAEMKCLAYQQISDEVGSQENATLHSDGTSKFGHHYGSYQISTDASVYSLGLCDMLTGSAELTLHSLKQILGYLHQVAGTGSGNNVLKIKNTMSDRHIVQKKF